MAKKKVNYVQLEPAAFISDVDYQMMNAEQRGVYCSLIFYLYANKGKLELPKNHSLVEDETTVITLLSNCNKTGEDWKKIWSVVGKKFQIKNGVLTHKRVTEELKRADNFRKKKSLAGKKGMQQRYNKKTNTVNNTDITKGSKGKLSKDNKKEKNKKEKKLAFEEVRKLYPGVKRGLDTEFNYFTKAHKDWAEVLPLLKPAIENQTAQRQQSKAQGVFVPEWKHFKSWLYNRYWELDSGSGGDSDTPQNNQYGTHPATPEEITELEREGLI